MATRETAFQCIAKFGDLVDLPTLLPYLDETTVIEKFTDVAGGITTELDIAPPGAPAIPDRALPQYEPVQQLVRINDLAAVTAMLILEEDPRSVFPNYSPNPMNLINSHDLAVSEQDSPKQTARIQAWAKAHAAARSEG